MSNWTQADIDRIRKNRGPTDPHKPSKYRNVKAQVGNEKFDSKREANYWMVLKARESCGEIKNLRRQVSFELRCPTSDHEVTSVVAHYVADYVYQQTETLHRKDYDVTRDVTHVVDAKGKRTALYSLKKKWLELQSDVVIEEV